MVTQQNIVHPSVVVAFELDERRPARPGTRQAESGLDGFGTRVGEDDLLGTRDDRYDFFCECDLAFVLCAEGVGFPERCRNRFVQLGVVRSQDERSPGKRVVQQRIPVYVVVIRSFRPLEEKGGIGDADPHARRYAQGEDLAAALVQFG